MPSVGTASRYDPLFPGGSANFSADGTFNLPPGIHKVTVNATGGTGTPGNGGNPGNDGATGNAGTAGTGGSAGGAGNAGNPGNPGNNGAANVNVRPPVES